MEQFVDHPPDGPGDFVTLDVIEARQPVLESQQFGVHHLGSPPAQRGDGRGDLRHPLTRQVRGNLGRDDLAGGIGVGGGGPRRGFALETFHVDHADSGQSGDGGVDIARHSEVAEHQWLGALIALRTGQGVMHIGQRHHRPHRPGTTDCQVGGRERRRQLVEGHRLRTDTLLGDDLHQPLRPGQRPVDDVDMAHAEPDQQSGRQAAH